MVHQTNRFELSICARRRGARSVVEERRLLDACLTQSKPAARVSPEQHWCELVDWCKAHVWTEKVHLDSSWSGSQDLAVERCFRLGWCAAEELRSTDRPSNAVEVWSTVSHKDTVLELRSDEGALHERFVVGRCNALLHLLHHLCVVVKVEFQDIRCVLWKFWRIGMQSTAELCNRR